MKFGISGQCSKIQCSAVKCNGVPSINIVNCIAASCSAVKCSDALLIPAQCRGLQSTFSALLTYVKIECTVYCSVNDIKPY